MMRTILFSCIVLVLSAVLLWAGGEAEDVAIEDIPDDELVTADRIGNPNADIVLQWWVQPDFSHRADNEELAEIYRDIYIEWARANPNVQIEISIQPDLGEMQTRMQVAASRGNPPDMAALDSFWIAWFVDGGYLQPLNQYIDEMVDDFYPFTIDGVSDSDGNIYALWKETDMRVLYYNTDYVHDPPRTWDELLDLGEQVAAEHNVEPFLYNGGRWEATTFDGLGYFWAQGGDLVDPETGAPVFGEEPHRTYLSNWLQFYRETIERGVSPSAVATITDYDDFEPYISADDVAMFVGGNWQIADIQRTVDDDEKWQVAPIPQQEPDMYATGTGGWTWGIFTDDPEKQQAAWDFFSLQAETENMGRITRTAGYLPTRASVYEMDPFFSEDPYRAQFGEYLEHGRSRPGVAIYPTISAELQVAINEVLTSDIPVEQAIDNAWEAVMREYDG